MNSNLLPNNPSTGSVVSIFTVGINSKSFLWPVHSVQEPSPNFLRRCTRVDDTAHNVTIDYWVMWHVRHSAQIAKRFEPNTVLWTFHTIQPSSWATVCRTVRLMLSDRCLSVCNIVVLWPNGWMDYDATWYGGGARPRRHCVRWGNQLFPQKGHSSSSTFRPMSIVAKPLDWSRCHLIWSMV